MQRTGTAYNSLVQRNKQYHRKVLLSSFHLNGYAQWGDHLVRPYLNLKYNTLFCRSFPFLIFQPAFSLGE